MNGDILFAILRKFRDVACYGRIEVDLSFAVQLHDGLGRGHDLRAGCHIEHGVHLHGTGIIQTNAHVIQHCISIGFFIDDLTTARHNDGRTREVALPHVVFHNGIDGGQSRILLDGHSRGLEAVFGLFRTCAACKCSGDGHGPHGLSGCDHKAAARDLFHGKLSFSSKKLKRLYHFRRQKYFIQYFVFLFQKKHLHILMQMLFSFFALHLITRNDFSVHNPSLNVRNILHRQDLAYQLCRHIVALPADQHRNRIFFLLI